MALSSEWIVTWVSLGQRIPFNVSQYLSNYLTTHIIREQLQLVSRFLLF